MKSDRAIYPLDRNHAGARFVVLLTVAAVGIAGMLAMRLVLPRLAGTAEAPPLCLSAAGSMIMALAAAWAVEQVLFKCWPSGRTLEIALDAITLHERSGERTTIQVGRSTQIILWYFILPRDQSGARRGWYCLACHLAQGESVIVPYAFLRPGVAANLPQWRGFERLLSRKEAAAQATDDLPPSRELSRLRGAEKDRWKSGCEMSPADFIDFLSRLDRHIGDQSSEAPTS